MPGRVALSQVTESVLDLAAHIGSVDDPAAGATVSFSGVVRNHDGGQQVACLLYTSPSPRDLSTSRMPSSA